MSNDNDNDNFNFDKFIDNICEREDLSRKQQEEYVKGQDEHLQRRFNERYQEHWQNRIRYGVKK